MKRKKTYHNYFMLETKLVNCDQAVESSRRALVILKYVKAVKPYVFDCETI